MKKKINRITLLLVMMLLAVNLFSRAISKEYAPGEKYLCKMGYAMAIQLPLTDEYTLEYEKSEDWYLEDLKPHVYLYPKKADKQLHLRIYNSKRWYIDVVVESTARDIQGEWVMKLYVEKFPKINRGPKVVPKAQPVPNEANSGNLNAPPRSGASRRRPEKIVFDNQFSLQGGLYNQGSRYFTLDGELILNVKTRNGLLVQTAGKVERNEYIEKYGISFGTGYEPHNIGLFLFVDGLSYKYQDYDSTFHFQIRPTLRVKFSKLQGTLFFAYGIGDRYTGVDKLVTDDYRIAIYNKSLSYYGISLRTQLFKKLFVEVDGIAAAHGVYRINIESGFEIFKRIFVTGNYQLTDYGRYPDLAREGFTKTNTYSIGVQYHFGNSKPRYDLRSRNIVPTHYPLVVSYQKKIEKEKDDKKPPVKPDELSVTLQGNPLTGKAPLSVNFTANPKGGVPPYNYKWDFKGDNKYVYGSAKEANTYYENGTYNVHVVVEDQKGNKATSNTVTVVVNDSGKYKIIAKAYDGAIIKPEGTILAEPGGDYKFVISAQPGYKIDRVEVDGKNIGQVIEYTFKKVDRDHRIDAWAKKDDGVKQYKIVSISNTGGHNEPEGTILVDEGSSLTVKIFADHGYRVKDVKVDGISKGPLAVYTFENIEQDHTIESFFEIYIFTIEAIQNQGGTITPPGITYVEKGASQTYVITVDEGQKLTDLLVDGKQVGAPQGNTYTFSNVNANHTIEPIFGQQTFTIDASSEGGGAIIESGQVQVVYGSNKTFTFKADEGYEPTELKVDGTIIPVTQNNEYTFFNVRENHTIHITFTKKKFTITVIYNQGGSVSPGTSVVEYGDNKTFEIKPLVSHNIQQVKVDGGEIGAQTQYTFENVTADHTLEAIFVIKTFDITVVTNEGTISKPGSVTVTYGSNQSFAFSTDTPGRYIQDVKIDNVSKGTQTGWTFTNITANHRIELFSEWYYYTVTETHQLGGVVLLNGQKNPGQIKVRWGESCQCTFDVNSGSGKQVQEIRIDGVSKGVIKAYKFDSVKEDHAVQLDVEWIYYTITVQWQGNGEIRPGTTRVRHGDYQSFTIFPATGNYVKVLKVDNAEVPITEIYTFTNVTRDHTIYAEFKEIPIPKYEVTYGGYSFNWWDPKMVPDHGTGGGGPILTEMVEQGQVFEYTYQAFVKDTNLPISQQFEIPFQYVSIDGERYYNRHITIVITKDTKITAYYSLDNR